MDKRNPPEKRPHLEGSFLHGGFFLIGARRYKPTSGAGDAGWQSSNLGLDRVDPASSEQSGSIRFEGSGGARDGRDSRRRWGGRGGSWNRI